MFTKILIANRGEIACRVMTTAKRMGIQTVAVYSAADQQARHVRFADEAVYIGEAASTASYLRGAAIIDAALTTNAQAIHPGYGFLSENPQFVEAVEQAGLVFIGPSASAIRAMGLKDAAKTLMAKAGVPVVPGYPGQSQDRATLTEEAERIGYPVLIKARAGGGGKGMRLVTTPQNFAEAFASAKREAQASFGDDHCLIEKYIAQSRHIEVQVFGDKHGNVVHMYERDCSLQRRHQKLVEEAPAPGMNETMRAAMTDAAVNAAKAIDYHGAGTVEFIVDAAHGLRVDGFWFMEMNTRLQVEHPVSESISGLDFVEWQLRIAAGERLPLEQSAIPCNGHAIEVRICAEDANRGFLPAVGAVDFMSSQVDSEFTPAPLRLDSAIDQGDEISPHYDPMIGKLIAHGDNRGEALARLFAGIEALALAPITTNTAFLRNVLQHDNFVRGEVDTGLIERDFAWLIADRPTPPPIIALAAIKAMALDQAPQGQDVWQQTRYWRHYGSAHSYVDVCINEVAHRVTVSANSDGVFIVTFGEEKIALRLLVGSANQLRYECVGQIQSVVAVKLGALVYLWQDGVRWRVAIQDHADVALDSHNSDQIVAPMPGLLQRLDVRVGDSVRAGDALAMLEAMKMEQVLQAPRDGVIAKIHVKQGQQISDGTILMELEAHND